MKGFAASRHACLDGHWSGDAVPGLRGSGRWCVANSGYADVLQVSKFVCS